MYCCTKQLAREEAQYSAVVCLLYPGAPHIVIANCFVFVAHLFIYTFIFIVFVVCLFDLVLKESRSFLLIVLMPEST